MTSKEEYIASLNTKSLLKIIEVVVGQWLLFTFFDIIRQN